MIKLLQCEEHISGNDGILIRQQKIILYNDKCIVPRQRFTIAHELGHYFLCHTGELHNREISKSDNPIETEANIFASRLLAPACVLWGLGAKSAEYIAEVCNISYTAAQFRAERMAQLYQREQEYLYTKGKSCFLLSSKERAVYRQFKPFIDSKL